MTYASKVLVIYGLVMSAVRHRDSLFNTQENIHIVKDWLNVDFVVIVYLSVHLTRLKPVYNSNHFVNDQKSKVSNFFLHTYKQP